jgi:hypothetical protein
MDGDPWIFIFALMKNDGSGDFKTLCEIVFKHSEKFPNTKFGNSTPFDYM